MDIITRLGNDEKCHIPVLEASEGCAITSERLLSIYRVPEQLSERRHLVSGLHPLSVVAGGHAEVRTGKRCIANALAVTRNRMTGKASSQMNIVRLQAAILCTDCEVISEGNGQCELCSSRAVLSLSRVLGRAEADQKEESNMSTRKYPRYGADIPLVATLIGDREVCTVRGKGRVISEGGLGAAMSNAIPIGHVVSLELHLANATETLRIRAVCRSCRAEQCGFEFIKLSEHEQEFIARYCRMQKRWSALKNLVYGRGAARQC